MTAVPSALPEHHCANCGTVATDQYCPSCGQNTRERLPTFRQFMREATGRYLAFDGKLWKTLFPLLFRPGFLTRAYFAGRRRRYIGPARLFLVSSLVLFAVLRLASEAIDVDHVIETVSSDTESGPAAETKGRQGEAARVIAKEAKAAANDAKTAANEAKTAAAKAAAKGTPVDATGKLAKDAMQSPAKDENKAGSENLVVLDDKLNFSVGDIPESMGPLKKRVDRFNQLTRGQKVEQILAGTLRYGPYAMFVLLPAFAALLKLVYLGRRRRRPGRPRLYGEHLVFAAHNHSFLFVVLCLLFTIPVDLVRQAIAFWIFCYLVWSTHAVYGGSWFGIAARGFVLLIVYAVLFSLVTFGLVIVAILLR
ncbi:MAG: DUF3667 domain-containing protein [Betaproteobacteria bacterium]